MALSGTVNSTNGAPEFVWLCPDPEGVFATVVLSNVGSATSVMMAVVDFVEGEGNGPAKFAVSHGESKMVTGRHLSSVQLSFNSGGPYVGSFTIEVHG